MYKIKKEFHFSASHILNGLKKGHPCGRLHGHNYIVIICLKDDKLNSVGFVQDYGDLNLIKEFLDSHWDHRHLNDCYPFNNKVENPSAEQMARFIFVKFTEAYPKMHSVTVSETPKTTATYYGK